jgi:multisubunit Na+/H+ antiporter MnhF subunit
VDEAGMMAWLAENWLDFAVNASMVILAASVSLTLLRLFIGPTVFDRIMSFDNVAVSIVGMVAILSVKWNSVDYLDIILLFTILGFVSTVAFCLFLHRVYRPHGIAHFLSPGGDKPAKPRRRSLFRRARKKKR